jgi:hypothetical protein
MPLGWSLRINRNMPCTVAVLAEGLPTLCILLPSAVNLPDPLVWASTTLVARATSMQWVHSAQVLLRRLARNVSAKLKPVQTLPPVLLASSSPAQALCLVLARTLAEHVASATRPSVVTRSRCNLASFRLRRCSSVLTACPSVLSSLYYPCHRVAPLHFHSKGPAPRHCLGFLASLSTRIATKTLGPDLFVYHNNYIKKQSMKDVDVLHLMNESC